MRYSIDTVAQIGKTDLSRGSFQIYLIRLLAWIYRTQHCLNVLFQVSILYFNSDRVCLSKSVRNTFCRHHDDNNL